MTTTATAPRPTATPWQRSLAAFFPGLSDRGLMALLTALDNDDQRLIQGATTVPPPLECVSSWPVDACDAIGFTAWQGDGLETVGEVEEWWARQCFEADQRLGEPAGCRWWLTWYDETPRDVMRRELSAEVRREIARRAGGNPEHLLP